MSPTSGTAPGRTARGTAPTTLAYRTPAQVGRNIALPHSRITKYIAGAHYGPTPGAQCGYSVILWKTRAITSFPSYSYMSWYQRVDDNWRFGGDDNFKTFAYSEGSGPYNLPNNWYAEYNPRPTSRTSGAAYHLNDDATGTATQSLQAPDQNGHSWWWNGAVNPMSGVWTKVEMELEYTNLTDGYVKLWENGVLKIDYRGPTDRLPGQRANGRDWRLRPQLPEHVELAVLRRRLPRLLPGTRRPRERTDLRGLDGAGGAGPHELVGHLDRGDGQPGRLRDGNDSVPCMSSIRTGRPQPAVR